MNKVSFKCVDLQGKATDKVEFWSNETPEVLLSDYLTELRSIYTTDSFIFKIVIEVETKSTSRSADVGCFIIGELGVFSITNSCRRLIKECSNEAYKD